jgi:hypothetical protein
LNPYGAVSLNAMANIMARSGRKDAAIEKYKSILNRQGKNDPYSMCGLGFLLLEEDQRAIYTAEIPGGMVEQEEATFNKIKNEITAANMINLSLYSTLLPIVLIYVRTVLMRKRILGQIYHYRF